MHLFVCVFLSLAAVAPAFAGRPPTGEYWSGGGIGATKCTVLLDTLNTVRLRGGFKNETLTLTEGYMMYLAGFQTAYDAMTPFIYDIFKGFDDHLDQVMVAMEPYCQANPTHTFDDALWDLISKLYPTSEVR